MNENLIELYKPLFQKLSSNNFPERKQPKNIVVFNAIQGKNFGQRRELMVIGRAPNGWGIYFNPDNKPLEKEVEKTIKKIVDRETTFDLGAEIKSWEKKDTPYFISRSQFWNISQRIGKTIFENNLDKTDDVVYSNLYKVSTDGNNPSNPLKTLILDDCVEILKMEITFFMPKRILFLTDYDNWAEPFINKIKAVSTSTSLSKYVKFIGKYNASEVVVAVHPQGKRKELANEIRSAFNLPLK